MRIIAPPRGSPLWEGEGTQETGEGVEAVPDWDMAAQPAPDYPDDQRTNICTAAAFCGLQSKL